MRPDLDIRSYTDTRAGAITLIVSAVLITAAAALGGLLQPLVTDDRAAHSMISMLAVTIPLTLAIPIVTVMMVAGEWADGSIQFTFLQRPRRIGVLAGRILASASMSALLVAFSVVLAAAFTWIGGELIGTRADFADTGEALAQALAGAAASYVLAVSAAVLLQSTLFALLAAIGIPFVLGIATGIATMTGSDTVADVVRAFDLGTAAAQLADGVAQWRDLLPVLTMVLIPFAFGARRWARREIG